MGLSFMIMFFLSGALPFRCNMLMGRVKLFKDCSNTATHARQLSIEFSLEGLHAVGELCVDPLDAINIGLRDFHLHVCY